MYSPDATKNALSAWALLLRAALFALLCLGGSFLGETLAFRARDFCAFWPPAGLMLGALLIHRQRQWPVFFFASLPVSIFFEMTVHRHGLFLSVALAAGNFLQASAGAWALHFFCKGTPSLSRVRDVLRLTVTALFSPVISSVLGICAAKFQYPSIVFFDLWPMWWSADALGILIITPMILAWSGEHHSTGQTVFRRSVKSGALFVALVTLAYLVFDSSGSLPFAIPYPYLTFPLLLWSALRLGIRSTVVASFFLSIIAIRGTAAGSGPFNSSAHDVRETALLLEVFVVVSHLCALLPAAIMAQWRTTQSALNQLNATLEERVAERTAQLQESQSRYQTLTSILPVGVARSEADGSLIYINDHWCEMTGIRREEALGNGWVRAIHPEDRDKLFAAWNAAVQQQRPLKSEHRMIGADGSVRWVFAQVTPEISNGKTVSYISSITDITERKRAEEALGRSEARYRFLANVMPQIVWTARPNGTVDYVNQRCLDYYGTTFEHLKDWSWQAVIHPEDLPECMAKWTNAFTNGVDYDIQHRLRRAGDGAYRWHLGRAFPLRNENGEIIQWVGTCTDIEDQKRTEAALNEAREKLEQRVEERTLALTLVNDELKREIAERERIANELVERESVLRSFFESAPMMMGVAEMADGDDNMVHVSVNAATDAFMGIAPGAMIGKSAVELGITRERMELWARNYRDSERTSRPARFDYAYESGGTQKHLAVTVAFIGRMANGRARYSYIAEDVTAQTTAQQALKRFAAILEATTDFVAITDTSGHIIYMNGGGRALTGTREDADLSDSTLLSFHPESVHSLVRHEGVPMAMLEGSWQAESALCAADGREIPVSQLILSHRSPNGRIEFLSTIIRDISEQKAAEQKIKTSLAEKEVLLKEIHHRVKNNMQIISSLLQLQSSCIRDPQALAIFDESRDRIKSMALIHEKLYQSNDLAQVDFPEYLRSLMTMVFAANRTIGQRIESRLHVDPISLSLDTAIPVGLIANELVTNSLKYAFRDRDAGEVAVELRRTGEGKYTLVIRDNGIGMPKDFSTGKSTSLGMRLVRILTKQIHGELEYSNGTGSEFCIHFSDHH